MDKVKRAVKRLWAMKHDFVEYTKEVVGTLAYPFSPLHNVSSCRKYIPFLRAQFIQTQGIKAISEAVLI